MTLRSRSLLAAGLLLPAVLHANTAPAVVIQSAIMRPGTSYMDLMFRVNDPDDATVKTRALAFIGGERSFAKVIKPVTFVEGTGARIGNAIPTNTGHVLTWDVGADWSTDLGQIKFEILAMDGRGLLPLDWITVPAAEGQPALTISKNAPSDAEILDALFWRYADGDPGLTLTDGVLKGSASSGVFSGRSLATGATVEFFGPAYALKAMNLTPADGEDITRSTAARAITDPSRWHALNRPYAGMELKVVAWGYNSSGQTTIPAGLSGITTISAGWNHSLALKSDGTVVAWGYNGAGQTDIPVGLSGVTAIAAGGNHNLALKADGTVVAWGDNGSGQTDIPAGLSGVTAIAAGLNHSLALKADGSVFFWGWVGYPDDGPVGIPTSGVSAIAAGWGHSLALKTDGTVIDWKNSYSMVDDPHVPAGLSGVTAIAAGADHNLALKADGTVVAWVWHNADQVSVPPGLSGVTAIAAGAAHSLALKADGSVVAWGWNDYGQTNVPAGLSGVFAIAAGYGHSLALKIETP